VAMLGEETMSAFWLDVGLMLGAQVLVIGLSLATCVTTLRRWWRQTPKLQRVLLLVLYIMVVFLVNYLAFLAIIQASCRWLFRPWSPPGDCNFGSY
jgi:hypothetical protein